MYIGLLGSYYVVDSEPACMTMKAVKQGCMMMALYVHPEDRYDAIGMDLHSEFHHA